MTDDQSWPLVVPTMPELAKLGAFSADHTYSPDDIKGLIEYGRLRGVRVVLEIECASTSAQARCFPSGQLTTVWPQHAGALEHPGAEQAGGDDLLPRPRGLRSRS